MTATPPATTTPTAAERRRAVLSSFLGSTVEYYDFLLYAAAAGLVFPKLFFGNLPTELGMTLSFVILLIGYISRPLGSVAFGHFGDRYGRKKVLVATLLTMGLVSVAIGLMPSSAKVGIIAPIALVLLRAIQGVAVGGEWAGATLMAMEHSKDEDKGFGASLAVAGGPVGAVLSTLVLALFSRISGDQFVNPTGAYFVSDWGWRVPFLLSACIVVLGLWLRTHVSESPEFEAARLRGDVHTGVPAMKVLRHAPKEVILGALAGAAGLFVQGIGATFMVPYVVKITEAAGSPVPRDQALMMNTVGSVIATFSIPFFAWLSDRFGRRAVMAAGGLVSIVGLWLCFHFIQTANPAFVWPAFVALVGIVQPAQYGSIGAFISEKFDPDYRYTGAGMTFQLASILGAGLAPLVATELVKPNPGILGLGALTNLAIYGTALFVISTVAVLISRETRHQMTHAERFQTEAIFEG